MRRFDGKAGPDQAVPAHDDVLVITHPPRSSIGEYWSISVPTDLRFIRSIIRTRSVFCSSVDFLQPMCKLTSFGPSGFDEQI